MGVIVAALRRIDKLEADRRRVQRSLDRCLPGSPLSGELTRQRDELDEQLAHYHEVVRRAQAAGFKVWTRQDFTRGDFVRYRNVWYEVLRVNARSVTVPHLHAPGALDGDVVRACAGRAELTWTVGYHDGITERMSAEEMAESKNVPRPKDHSE